MASASGGAMGLTLPCGSPDVRKVLRLARRRSRDLPCLQAPSAGTKPCPGYRDGLAEGREETRRALLEAGCRGGGAGA